MAMMIERIPEPELMEDKEQALAYAGADFSDINQDFVERFLDFANPEDGAKILDLGCGPADIPIRMASARPGVLITGVDGAKVMLDIARIDIDGKDLKGQITLVEGRMPNLPLEEKSFDAILSNSLLHQLHKPEIFWEEIKRLAKPGAAVFTIDLVRPESKEEAENIVKEGARKEPEILKKDFFNSLMAAFSLDEVKAQLEKAGLSGLKCEKIRTGHLQIWGRLPE